MTSKDEELAALSPEAIQVRAVRLATELFGRVVGERYWRVPVDRCAAFIRQYEP